jgi:hypothetical protein
LDLTGAQNTNPWIADTSTGVRSNRLPGAILIHLPAYLIIGGGSFSVAPSAITASVVTAAAVALMFLAMREVVGLRLALLSALVLVFCTGTWTVSANLS